VKLSSSFFRVVQEYDSVKSDSKVIQKVGTVHIHHPYDVVPQKMEIFNYPTT